MTLLRAVLQKLSVKKVANDQAGSPEANALLQERYATLQQLQASRQILEVVPAGQQRSYQSMIIALDVERNLLWLDDLFPAHRQLELGHEITLRHHRNGEVLTFTTPVIAWGSRFGATGMAVILPEFAEYQPRRMNSRCDLSNHSAISAKIRLMGQEACYGTIKDISSSGLCVMVPGNLLGQLHRDTVLPLCEVHLTKELHIYCRARVRSFRLCREPYRATSISLEFVDLQPRRQQQLQHFIDRLTPGYAADSRAA
jgi:c-di-GMP-binding flagellar brake protein YcgR